MKVIRSCSTLGRLFATVPWPVQPCTLLSANIQDLASTEVSSMSFAPLVSHEKRRRGALTVGFRY